MNELSRLKALYAYETAARDLGYKHIAGVDEAGRGCLFGPVVAAACIIPEGVWIEGVNDSKKLTPLKRASIFSKLIRHAKVSYAVGIVSAAEIDEINIYQASIRAMILALNGLEVSPDYALVDGMQLFHERFTCKKIVGGDALSYSIAAASIIAKETRDRLVLEYHEKWPNYGLDSHKGYGTKKHLDALKVHGPTPLHRFTFEPLKGS
ncbi:MAG: ribonuclease HII [Chlamydiales bacterium]|nr:ribonuclease HII [Chlamydiales bacterium]